MVAAAAIGGAVIGGVSSNVAANKQSKAIGQAADAAADASVQSTQMQIGEIQRQFDLQMQIMEPLVQQQYAAGAAYQDLLGIGGGRVPQPANDPGPVAGNQNTIASQGAPRQIAPGSGAYRPGAPQQRLQNNVIAGTQSTARAGAVPDLLQLGGDAPSYNKDLYANSPAYREAWGQLEQWHNDTYGRAIRGDSTPSILDGKLREFMEANPNFEGYENLAPEAGPGASFNARYPGEGSTIFQRDENGAFIDANLNQRKLAGPSMQEDDYFNYITNGGEGVYGTEFESSPGYEFQVEEMGRELDRRNSRGGNYGGRAVVEAQRRAQGLAKGDYYNWAAGRERDLSRGSRAAENFLVRDATDLQRQDQGYYNYLSNLARTAGFGNTSAQAVNSSQAAASATSSAIGTGGNTLASIYSNQGNNLAGVEGDRVANINNQIQGGISNYLYSQAIK